MAANRSGYDNELPADSLIWQLGAEGVAKPVREPANWRGLRGEEMQLDKTSARGRAPSAQNYRAHSAVSGSADTAMRVGITAQTAAWLHRDGGVLLSSRVKVPSKGLMEISGRLQSLSVRSGPRNGSTDVAATN